VADIESAKLNVFGGVRYSRLQRYMRSCQKKEQLECLAFVIICELAPGPSYS